ncbi:MAG: amino acid permease [Gammaproteobacteria bacterium]|nr:amino acid permease [Gammaproteobacteria bacterium]
MPQQTCLKRTLSLPMMVLYGLGTTIGAGIYALVGEVAGIAGYFAPFSFLIASILAGFTAVSFAEISARFPLAAGAVVYVYEGLGSRRLSIIVGLMVMLAGLVSASALVNAFIGYLNEFVELDRTIAILLVCFALGALAVWGIAESVTVASIITLIEIAGLLLIVYVGRDSFSNVSQIGMGLLPPLEFSAWTLIFSGVILSFYAFIGFEDMVHVAEEVKDVKKNLPLAIILTLIVTTVLYFIIMYVAVLSVEPGILAQSKAPLAFIYQIHTGGESRLISVIGLFAVINGALIQIIMGSRILYGMSMQKHLPKFLGFIHPRTRTPTYATFVAVSIVLILAIIGKLASLAVATSIIMLVIFSLVNLSLWVVKKRDPAPEGVRVFPLWVPIVGFIVSAMFVSMEVINLLN